MKLLIVWSVNIVHQLVQHGVKDMFVGEKLVAICGVP
jgi:hypothetical protein